MDDADNRSQAQALLYKTSSTNPGLLAEFFRLIDIFLLLIKHRFMDIGRLSDVIFM